MPHWWNICLFFNVVFPKFHTFLPVVLQCFDPIGIKTFILISKKVLNSWYDLIISPISLASQMFFHIWEQKKVTVPNPKNMGRWSTVKATVVQGYSLSQQPLQPQTCVQEHCPGETGPLSSVFVAFLTWLTVSASSASWHNILCW